MASLLQAIETGTVSVGLEPAYGSTVDERADLAGAGHTITVERLTSAAACTVGLAEAAGHLAVVERHDGRLGKICLTSASLYGITIERAARGIAHTYGATFVPEHPWKVFAEAAECVYDPELHTGPPSPESASERAARVAVAREVCQSCPIRPACLDYARACAPTSGVWAGHTAEELAALAAAPGELGEVA